jgi:acyl transferase domain-containing protein/NAD(P)-dependent dehydrogenase (short-subunit alcohol dehydrogenase family)/acyl-CoA thioesterase FadM
MGVFKWPYRVLFQDTMAYGTHHFLTNFKFQCEAREHLFFKYWMTTPERRAEHENLVMLTHEGYSRNLAPVSVGDTVGILLTREDTGPSSVRMCFRVVRSDGTPVCCGYQTLVSSNRAGTIVPATPAMRRFGLAFREKLTEPSFAERVVSGTGLDRIFDETTIREGVSTALGSREGSMPASLDRPIRENALVFTFPGAGSSSPRLLADLATLDFLGQGELVRQAEQVCQDLLGVSLQPLFLGGDAAEQLRTHPGLAQVVIYLANVIPARWLQEQGAEPDLLVGHSLGEIASLAIGGACSLETGLLAVTERAKALEHARAPGGMLVLFTHAKNARSLVDVLGRASLDLAVMNLADQTVVSGNHPDLDRLAALATQSGVACTRLGSAYPFHSRLLEPCVAPFAEALRKLGLKTPAGPSFSPMERDFWSDHDDLSGLLASHFTRPLAFSDVLRDVYELGGRRFVECGGGRALTGIVDKALEGKGVRTFPTMAGDVSAALNRALSEGCGVAGRPAHRPLNPRVSGEVASTREATSDDVDIPIAIVGIGCVLPGALNPDQLWDNILGKRVAIAERALADIQDFYAEGDLPTPDKTYSRLAGWVRDFKPAGPQAGFRTAAQQMLGEAVSQCLQGAPADPARTQVLVGSTGDGCREYEGALLVAGIQGLASKTGHDCPPPGLKSSLEAAVGLNTGEGADLSPWSLWDAVGRRLVGSGVKVLAFDAACASSLYSMIAGVRNLRRGECDLALAGGVFTPGAPNASLFAQFRGLSQKGARPFDAAADGVVFSEGAAMLALKRLPDALAANDRIFAVIRGYGCSSDGKSASVMEPREAGQTLALKRAHSAAGVDPSSIQYLEAHATATAVGDAVEVKAAAKLLQGQGQGVALGSLKANIGHSGWAAGAASMIKVVSALVSKTIPPQAAFAAPSPKLDLAHSQFHIPTQPAAWPQNASGEPRRAGVNGFGFGGSNAHVVVEEFEPGYHARLAARSRKPKPRESVAVTAISFLQPSNGKSFTSEELELPDRVRILPDVFDHMDRGQVLAIKGAYEALCSLPGWEALAEETGVILGVEGKTGRGVEAALRVCRDHIARRLRETGAAPLADEVAAQLSALLPSGPFTLLGLMPNVIAGRVSNTFNLKGANLALDAHRASLVESVELARRLIEEGECGLALAGAIGGTAHHAIATLVSQSRAHPENRPLSEAALLLALTPLSVARDKGWPVLAILGDPAETERPLAVGGERSCLLGAEGAFEVARAVDAARRGERTSVSWSGGGRLSFAPGPGIRASATLVATRTVQMQEADGLLAATMALVELEDLESKAFPVRGQRTLVLSDRPGWCRSKDAQELLSGLNYRFVTPRGAGLEGAVELDLATEETLAKSLAELPAFDVILAIADVLGEETSSLEDRQLLELTFALARHAYSRIASGEVSLGSIIRGAQRAGDQLHPLTGLLAGFAKSLARELPQARIKVVVDQDDSPQYSLERLENELGAPGWPVEVVYRRGRRLAFQLIRTKTLAIGDPPKPGSVVVATGGARGVTAVLVEALLEVGDTAILLGRSDPEALPPSLRELDDAAFVAREPGFYEEELSRGGRLPALKKLWQSYAASREVALNLKALESRNNGRVFYRICDVRDASQVDSVVAGIVRDHGGIDLIVHGAGIQTSKLLPRRTLAEMRTVLGTKLSGLENLRQACASHVRGARPHFHLVSSVAGFAGNPGQADYSAANDALVRIAACRSVQQGEGEWSAVAWPGWEGIGMASGSEYKAIAAATGQRWLSREEGKGFFAAVMSGRPALSVLTPVRERDLVALGLPLLEAPGVLAASCRSELNLETHPFLAQHTVNGSPTVPGAYLLDMAGQAALSIRPAWRVVRFAEATFDRFVKVPAKGTTLSVLLRVVSQDEGETIVHARVVSDFAHASGVVLQRGIEHAATFVVLAPRGASLGVKRDEDLSGEAIEVEDPYQSHESPVRLTGAFGALRSVACRPRTSSAHFRPTESLEGERAVLPVLLLDALFRVAGTTSQDGHVPISVPVACARLEISDRPFQEPSFLLGAAPRFDGDTAHMDWGEAYAPDGRLLIRFSKGIGRRVGRVLESRLPQ